MATYEDTNRSGRKICTMRSLGRDAIDNSPWVLTWQEGQKPTMANQVDRAPRRQCRLGYFSGGVDRPYGKKTNMRETSERSAVLRESLRVIYAAVFSHSGGTEAKGGEIGGRRCYFSRVGSVFAPPESTCRAEQKPIMANQLARAPRWQCRLGFFAAGVDRPYGKLPNFRTQLRFGRVFSDLYWVAFFRSDRTKTKRGEQDGRRRFFERVGSVFASLESTPSSGKHKHRRGRCADGAFR